MLPKLSSRQRSKTTSQNTSCSLSSVPILGKRIVSAHHLDYQADNMWMVVEKIRKAGFCFNFCCQGGCQGVKKFSCSCTFVLSLSLTHCCNIDNSAADTCLSQNLLIWCQVDVYTVHNEAKRYDQVYKLRSQHPLHCTHSRV